MPTTWNLRLQTAARIKPVKPKTLCVSRGNASRSTFFRWPNFLFHASNNHQIAIAPRRNQRRTLIIMIIMKIIKMFSSFALGSRKEHRWRQIIANNIVYQSFLLFWEEKKFPPESRLHYFSYFSTNTWAEARTTLWSAGVCFCHFINDD